MTPGLSCRLAADAFVDLIKAEVGTFCRLWLVYLNVCCALAWTKPQDDHGVKSGPPANGRHASQSKQRNASVLVFVVAQG